MFSALFYLQFQSIRNRLRAWRRRLKQPKYILGLLAFIGYFGLTFAPMIFAPGTDARAGMGLILPTDPATVESFGALALFFLFGLTLFVVVVFGFFNARTTLAFTETEVAFLFPAPISRRGLIHFKLIRSQFAIFLQALILTVLRSRWSSTGHLWITILGWWVIFSTLRMFTLAASFARLKLFGPGSLHFIWRVAITLLTSCLVALALIIWTDHSMQALGPPADADRDSLVAWLNQALGAGPVPYLLYPFRVIVRPLLAPDALTLLLAVGPALAFIAVLYFFIIRANVAFEEAAVEHSKKIADRIATFRAGGMAPGLGVRPKKARRDPFRLKPIGPPAIAILWKNLLLAGHLFTGRALVMLVYGVGASIMFASTLYHHSTVPLFIGAFSLLLLMFSYLFGPVLLRQDFRSDLVAADLLKLYPLPGWQIVLGEILAPVVILTSVQWLLLLLAAFLFHLPDELTINGAAGGAAFFSAPRLIIALGAALIIPALNTVLILIPNAIALLLPGWVRLGPNVPRGVEMIGQNLILGIGRLFVMLVCLVPVALGAGAVFFTVNLIFGPLPAIPLAALVAAVALAAEAALAIYFLGGVFEHSDLAGESTA